MRMLHNVAVLDNSTLAQTDRLTLALLMAVANVAGSGAGAAVTVAVVFAETMPANYHVSVDTGQDATWWVTARTAAGFTLNLSPRLAANTLAIGTVNIKVEA